MEGQKGPEQSRSYLFWPNVLRKVDPHESVHQEPDTACDRNEADTMFKLCLPTKPSRTQRQRQSVFMQPHFSVCSKMSLLRNEDQGEPDLRSGSVVMRRARGAT